MKISPTGMVNLAIKVFFLCSVSAKSEYTVAYQPGPLLKSPYSLLRIVYYLSINMRSFKKVSVATLYMAFSAMLPAVLAVPAATASYVNWTTFPPQVSILVDG